MHVELHARLRMLELDVYHMHKLGHTSCHAVDCIPSLLDVLKAFSGRC